MEGQLRMVAMDAGSGPVLPGVDAVVNGKYDKLSRTIYVCADQPMLARQLPLDLKCVCMLINGAEKLVSLANLIALRSLHFHRLAVNRFGVISTESVVVLIQTVPS